MKQLYLHLILCTCLICSIHHSSFAINEECTEVLNSTLPSPTVPEQLIEGIEFRNNCTAYQYMHYYNGATHEEGAAELRCTACRRGYSLITLIHSDDGIETSDNCNNGKRHAVVCAKPCDDTCVDDFDWANDSSSVESFMERTCKYGNKVCVSKEYFRCQSNYFGTPTADEDNCISCQSATGQSGSISPAGAETITECYLPANKTLSDNIGQYTLSENCYYSK